MPSLRVLCFSVLAALSATALARPALPHQDASEALSCAITGLIAHHRKQFDEASDLFLRSAQLSRDPRLAQMAWEVLPRESSSERRDAAISLWEKLDRKNPDARLLSAFSDMSRGKFFLPKRALRSLLKESDKPAQLLIRIADGGEMVPDKGEFHATLCDLAKPWLVNAKVRIALAKSARDAGLTDECSEHALAAIAIEPDNERVLLGACDALYPSAPQKLPPLLRAYLKRHPDALNAQMALAGTLITQGTSGEVRTILERVTQKHANNPRALMKAAEIAERGKMPELSERYLLAARTLLEKRAKSRRQLDIVHERLSDLCLRNNRLQDALSWIERVSSGPRHAQAQVKKAEILIRMQRVDEAVKLLDAIAVPDANRMADIHRMAASLLLSNDRKADAARHLGKASELLPDDRELLYGTALLAVELKDWDRADALFIRFNAKYPDDSRGLNTLAYTYATRNVHLQEARKMAKAALLLTQEKDAAILDTYGWILYRLGELEQAADYLYRALNRCRETSKEGNEDEEIVLHLAEVLFSLGQRDKATELARKVLKDNPKNLIASDLLKANGIEP